MQPVLCAVPLQLGGHKWGLLSSRVSALNPVHKISASACTAFLYQSQLPSLRAKLPRASAPRPLSAAPQPPAVPNPPLSQPGSVQTHRRPRPRAIASAQPATWLQHHPAPTPRTAPLHKRLEERKIPKYIRNGPAPRAASSGYGPEHLPSGVPAAVPVASRCSRCPRPQRSSELVRDAQPPGSPRRTAGDNGARPFPSLSVPVSPPGAAGPPQLLSPSLSRTASTPTDGPGATIRVWVAHNFSLPASRRHREPPGRCWRPHRPRPAPTGWERAAPARLPAPAAFL